MTTSKVNKAVAFAHSSRLRSSIANATHGGLLTLAFAASPAVWADLSAGVWANYRYVTDSSGISADRDDNSLGDIADEAVILYLDHQAQDSKWSLSAEMRYGPGAFTNPSGNSTGDNFVLHKGYLNYQIDDNRSLKLGKSQVPFGWKTVNFWPGDILQAGYGDQMDVGVKYSVSNNSISYDLAYYHADDWGETSTDTVDDNGHWGSSTTYRKVQTFVANIAVPLNDNHTLAFSAQGGNLQDLTNVDPTNPVDGSHSGAVLYYLGQFDQFNVKAEAMQVQRSLPKDYAASINTTDDITNTRVAIELGYKSGPWYWYLDSSWATPGDQPDDSVDTVSAFAPGVSYDYGPGWFYLEALTQDGWVGSNGEIGEGDFTAVYITADYYF